MVRAEKGLAEEAEMWSREAAKTLLWNWDRSNVANEAQFIRCLHSDATARNTRCRK